MLAQRLQRWPDIETALGECPVLAWTAMGMTFSPPVARKAPTQITRYIGLTLM